MRRLVSALVLLAAVSPAAAFADAPDIAATRSQAVSIAPADAPKLWATVNICDTAAAPNAMGVRAGMRGNGTAQRMYMRFKAEYWSRSGQAWTPVGGSGVSPWVRVGRARTDRRQAGWTFSFIEPPAGATFTMRAVVEFEWRGKRVRSRRRLTRTGIPGVQGGDPAGTSKAMCLIY